MKWLVNLLVLLILISAGAAAFIWSGVYDVSANIPHYGVSKWLIETMKENSIIVHAEGIGTPAGLEDPGVYKTGIEKFDASCRQCHGAPGEPRQEFAAGLEPTPPALVSGRVQKEWTDAQLYLIIKNGLKFTGMPSFGVIHNDSDIWCIIGVVKVLPDLKPADYRAIMAETDPSDKDEENCLPENNLPQGPPPETSPRMKPDTI